MVKTKPPPTSESNGKVNNNNKPISRFFQPKSTRNEKGAPRIGNIDKDCVILLDDDDNDDEDLGGDAFVIDLTGGLEGSQEGRSETNTNNPITDVGIGVGGDGADEEYSVERTGTRIPPPKRDSDKARDEVKPQNNDHDSTTDDHQACSNRPPSDTGPDGQTNHDSSSSSRYNNNYEPIPQNPSSIETSNKENPFAKFSHSGSSATPKRRLATKGFVTTTRSVWQMHSSSSGNRKRTNSDTNKNKTNHKKAKEPFVKIKDLPPEEQTRISVKWHSMADPSASLEDRRYQVLLAARLHARCQEPTVRKAMTVLQKHFASLPETSTITVQRMAGVDPETLAGHISNLQFYNAKAKQIVKAAQEIQGRHGGIVPEDEFSLLQITGIGKTFGDLLAFVNTRENHEKHSC